MPDQPDPNALTLATSGIVRLPPTGDSSPPLDPAGRFPPPGSLVGGAAGLLAGSLSGGACCCILDQGDYLWFWVLAGALAGVPGGVVIGALERKARGRLTRPDTATYVCVAFGLLTGVLVLPAAGLVTGKFSALLFMGAVFTGPAVGLLLGAMLDRAYEATLRRSRREALRYGFAGVAVTALLLWALTVAAAHAEPADVARAARDVIMWEWSTKPELRGAQVRNVSVVYKGDRVYEGYVDATVGGRTERLRLRVVYYDDRVRELSLAEAEE